MPQLRRSVPSLAALTTFEAAARLGSFTAAAQDLGVTQAAVSRQIKLLEDELRTPLFARLHRRVELTAAGNVLALAVGQSFERIADAIEVIRQPEMTGALTVSTTLAISHFWLLPRLPGFRAVHPDIKLRVWSSDAVTDLRDGDVDIALRFGKPPYRDGEVVASKDDEAFPVCSPDFLERLGPDFSVSQLADLPLIDSDIPDPTWTTWRKWFALAGLRRPTNLSTLRFSHYSDAVYAAISGQGVTLGWRLLLERALTDGRLVPLGDVHVVPEVGYHAVVPRGKVRTASMDHFIDWIEESFRTPFEF